MIEQEMRFEVLLPLHLFSTIANISDTKIHSFDLQHAGFPGGENEQQPGVTPSNRYTLLCRTEYRTDAE